MKKSGTAVLLTVLIAVFVALIIHFSSHHPDISQTSLWLLEISCFSFLVIFLMNFPSLLIQIQSNDLIRNEGKVERAVCTTILAIILFSAVLNIWSDIASNRL